MFARLALTTSLHLRREDALTRGPQSWRDRRRFKLARKLLLGAIGEESVARGSSIHTCVRPLSETVPRHHTISFTPQRSRGPKRRSRKRRPDSQAPGFPQPRMSSICVAMPPTAQRRRGTEVGARNPSPPKLRAPLTRNRRPGTVLLKAIGSSIRAHGGARNFRILCRPRGFHRRGAGRKTGRNLAGNGNV